MNKLIKTVSANKLSYEFLHSLNGILGLTDRELQLLSMMLDLHLLSLKSRKQKQAIDCTSNRKFVISNAGVTRDNLSRYIKTYKTKGIFVKDQDGLLVVNKALIPILIGGKTVQITLILKLNEND